VIQNVWLGIEDRIKRILITIEVGYQNFNLAFRIERPHLPHSLSPMRRAAVRQIVTVNGRYYRVGQIKLLHSFGNVTRFFRVERAWFSFADRAKSAVTRANVTAEHEGCGAIGPALENVWAARLLADRVQIKTLNQLQHVILIGRIAQANL
jgi:hypothetical protein